jgi:hypothetical protein
MSSDVRIKAGPIETGGLEEETSEYLQRQREISEEIALRTPLTHTYTGIVLWRAPECHEQAAKYDRPAKQEKQRILGNTWAFGSQIWLLTVEDRILSNESPALLQRLQHSGKEVGRVDEPVYFSSED